jgi:hypothetical protein
VVLQAKIEVAKRVFSKSQMKVLYVYIALTKFHGYLMTPPYVAATSKFEQ